MRYFQREFLTGFPMLAIVIILLAVALLHNASLSRQLTQRTQELVSLQQQLTTAERQRCSQSYDWKSDTRYNLLIESSGGTRHYTVHTPASYTADQRYPVVIAFDGLGGSAYHAERVAGLDSLPALTVYPSALIGQNGYSAWQGAPYSPVGVSDVQFMDDMLNKISEEFCIETDEVYMIGMSNGAGFALLAACELRGRIAGVAGISGAYYTQCRHDNYSQQRMLLIHSADDAITPFSGDSFRRLPNIYEFSQARSHESSCQQMLKIQGTAIERFNWSQCNEDRRISLIITHQQQHGWLRVADTSLVPDGALVKRTTSAIIWDFFTSK